MREGRAIYVGAERIDDVTRHPAFRNAARTIANLYEFKADPQRRELFSFDAAMRHPQPRNLHGIIDLLRSLAGATPLQMRCEHRRRC